MTGHLATVEIHRPMAKLLATGLVPFLDDIPAVSPAVHRPVRN